MKQRKAFTIIEVVLVLAVAGLIFLMVFIALPALQRSQRNTRRRQDIARIATAVTNYQANNNKLPFPADGNKYNNVDNKFVKKYISNCTVDTHFNYRNTGYFNGNSITAGVFATYNCTESDQFVDPDGTSYNIWSPSKDSYDDKSANDKPTEDKLTEGTSIDVIFFEGNVPSFTDNNHLIIALAKAKCADAENKADIIEGANNFALFYLLEGGSVYCVDNQ